MADAVELRQALAAFLGSDRFRKFVQQGVRQGRLRYWQEQEWGRFTAAHPEFAVNLAELAVAIRICELHGDELQPDTVEVLHGYIEYAAWYVQARNLLFPHAASGPVATEGAPVEEGQVGVWYCPACRQAEANWRRTRRIRGPT
jgi:hypothetical protein